MVKRKKKPPVRYLWALYDAQGELFDVHESKEEAHADAVGPRFRPRYTVRCYELVLRKNEPEDPSAGRGSSL